MVANHIAMETSPSARALEMIARIDALVENGEWSRTQQLVERIKIIVPEVQGDERQQVLRAFAHCLDRVQSMALASRNDVAEKLSAVRRGRMATRAYGQPEGSRNDNALR